MKNIIIIVKFLVSYIAGSLTAVGTATAASAAASVILSTAELSTAQHGTLEQRVQHLGCRRQAAVTKECIKAVEPWVEGAAAV